MFGVGGIWSKQRGWDVVCSKPESEPIPWFIANRSAHFMLHRKKRLQEGRHWQKTFFIHPSMNPAKRRPQQNVAIATNCTLYLRKSVSDNVGPAPLRERLQQAECRERIAIRAPRRCSRQNRENECRWRPPADKSHERRRKNRSEPHSSCPAIDTYY